MCGIIGIISSRDINICEILFKSLFLLTYRGYDSCGYAIKTKNNIFAVKESGVLKKDDFVFNKKRRI